MPPAAPPTHTPGVFISHSWVDKRFARRLSADLEAHGLRVWIDEAEILVGDSLIEKIRAGIDEMDFVAAIISKSSCSSPWVARELDIASTQEIEGRRIKVIPLLLEDCDLPGFLKGKAFADFRDPAEYEASLASVLKRIGPASSLPTFLHTCGRTVLVDTHCHIRREGYDGLRLLLHRARRNGVCTVVVSPDRTNPRELVEFARKSEGMFVILGGHPIHSRDDDDHLLFERQQPLLGDDVVVGIESGLDSFPHNANTAAQEHAFAEFIAAARMLHKPLVIQVRESERRALEILKSERANDVGGVIHAFANSDEFAYAALDLGFDIAFSGLVTYPANSRLRRLVARIPQERILAESMSPYFAPQGARGKPSEPQHVIEIVRTIAEARGAAFEDTAIMTTINAARRFGASIEAALRHSASTTLA